MINSDSGNVSALVMGVGRSGTTAVYSLLQEIMEDLSPGNVDYVYEPFLWNRYVFNKPYESISDEFCYSASVSIEGMYHHKKIPILAGENYVISPPSGTWLKDTLSAQSGKRHYIGKMIRGNGRIRLIRELSPSTKIIFIIRNPLDVLNSATQMFSFFGTEFYESDFSRFAVEVEERFGTAIESSQTESSQTASEYAFWYYSNLAFLEFANKNPTNILSISYEAFVEDRERIVRQICQFLGIEFHSRYATASQRVQGMAQQGTSALSEDEFAFLHRKLKAYDSLLQYVNVVPKELVSKLVKTYSWTPYMRQRSSCLPFNSLHAGKVIDKYISECTKLNDELSRIKNSARYRMINRLLAPIDALRKRKA